MSTTKIRPTACATRRQPRRNLGIGIPGRVHLTVPPRRRRARHSSTTVALSALPIDVCAKASTTVPDKLGDCPFCQRVLLTLEEKQLPYDIKLIEFSSKPEWFLKPSPDGKVPLVKLEENWIASHNSSAGREIPESSAEDSAREGFIWVEDIFHFYWLPLEQGSQ